MCIRDRPWRIRDPCASASWHRAATSWVPSRAPLPWRGSSPKHCACREPLRPGSSAPRSPDG
eukprot:6002159-Alexandrium_andersonii.AAC.1